MKNFLYSTLFFSGLTCFSSLNAHAEMVMFELKINMYDVSDINHKKSIGFINVADTPEGLRFTPHLSGLTAGLHGFHVHENLSCAPKEKDGKMIAAGGAGSHLDPEKTEQHGAPSGGGHLGDLPPLLFDEHNQATQVVIAPRLKMRDLSGRTLIIHAGGDNHADTPLPLGGGGARVACGFIGY